MKTKKIENLLNKLNKVHGCGIYKASELKPYALLRTPFPTLNTLVGGFHKARFHCIAGPQHTGKSTLLLQVVAYNQQINEDFVCLWTDAENAFSVEWAERLGVDIDRLLLQKYDDTNNTSMERMLENGLTLVRESKAVDMWIIDSVGGLQPKREQVKDLEAESMMILPKKLGEFLRKANIIINRSEGYDGCCVFLIGQVYSVPNTQGITLEEVRGGNALKHFTTVRLLMRRAGQAESPDKIDVTMPDGKSVKLSPGWTARVRVDKTRVNSNERQEILLPFYFGRGFDCLESTISAAFGLGIIRRSGPMYLWDGFPDGKVKGRKAVSEFFRGNEQAYNELAGLIDSVSVKKVEENECD